MLMNTNIEQTFSVRSVFVFIIIKYVFLYVCTQCEETLIENLILHHLHQRK